MKKTFIFMTILGLISFTSCVKDPEVVDESLLLEGNYSVNIDFTLTNADGSSTHDTALDLPMVITAYSGKKFSARGCISGMGSAAYMSWSNHSISLIADQFPYLLEGLGKMDFSPNYNKDKTDIISIDWKETIETNVGTVTIIIQAVKTNRVIHLVYYAGKYTTPSVYAWNLDGTINYEWPGYPMTKTERAYCQKDVYVYASWKNWGNIIFNDLTTKEQTDDLIYQEDDIYIFSSWEKFDGKSW